MPLWWVTWGELVLGDGCGVLHLRKLEALPLAMGREVALPL